MLSFRRLTILALPLLGIVLCEEPASQARQSSIYANAHETFQDLLNALPEESLRVALSSLSHFKAGVFESHRHGVERVHQENPSLATKLIVAAVKDLRKRQIPASTNGTSSSSPTANPTPSSEPPQPSSEAPPPSSEAAKSTDAPAPLPESSQNPPAIIPVPVSTTDSNGKPTVITSDFLSQATAFVPVSVTHTNDQGNTVVGVETKPAVVISTTDSAGSAYVTTSAVDFAPTNGQVLTTTNGEGSTILTTYTPGGGRISSILLITSTGGDGQPTVVTSYTFVEPGATAGPNAASSKPSTGRPGLQSGVANKNRAMEAAMVGGAVGGVFALFV